MKITTLTALGVCLASTTARADLAFNYGNLQNMTDSAAKSMIKTVAFGTDERALMPATSMGMLIGVDVGASVTALSVPQAFKDALALAGNTKNVPSLLPVPTLSAHKGLPFGIDVGLTYFKYQEFQLIGGDLKYSIIDGDNLAKPSLAVRASYSKSDLSYIKTHTWSFDVLASKPLLLMFDPYVGAGLQMGSGRLDVPASANFPSNVSSSQSLSSGHVYAGLPIKLALMRITAEYDYSFSGFSSLAAKFSLGF